MAVVGVLLLLGACWGLLLACTLGPFIKYLLCQSLCPVASVEGVWVLVSFKPQSAGLHRNCRCIRSLVGLASLAILKKVPTCLHLQLFFTETTPCCYQPCIHAAVILALRAIKAGEEIMLSYIGRHTCCCARIRVIGISVYWLYCSEKDGQQFALRAGQQRVWALRLALTVSVCSARTHRVLQTRRRNWRSGSSSWQTTGFGAPVTDAPPRSWQRFCSCIDAVQFRVPVRPPAMLTSSIRLFDVEGCAPKVWTLRFRHAGCRVG
jgi:hypothetical protein